MRAHKKESRKNLVIIILLLVLIVSLAAVCVWALFLRDGSGDSDILAPDYAPMDQDPNATDMGDSSGEALKPSAGGGAVGLEYSDIVTVDLSEKALLLHFGNPSRSYNNMVLQIVVQDTLLAQSELLIPGKKLPKLPLNEDAVSRLNEGGYKGKFIVSFYDPKSGEKSMVDSEIEITVNVQK